MVDRYKMARKRKIEESKRKPREKGAKPREERVKKTRTLLGETIEDWVPKSKLGKKVVAGEVQSLDDIFDKNLSILEPLIVDHFISELKEKIIDTKKTSYVRMSGRKYSFRCSVLVGDGSKFLGIGTAKDTDKWNAVRKAARKARLSMVRVSKGCGSWQCACGTEHSVPITVEGKCGSVRVKIMPAPQGVGLVVADSIKPVFEFAGVKDVWGKSFGSTSTTLNFVKAAIEALSKTHK